MALQTDTSMAPNDVSLLQAILAQQEAQSKSLATIATEVAAQSKSFAAIATALTQMAAPRAVDGIAVVPGTPTTH